MGTSEMPNSYSDSVRKQLAKGRFKDGTEALMRKDWDMACDMFRQASALVPGNLLFRQSLEGAERCKRKQTGLD
jgi:hypothetical protein